MTAADTIRDALSQFAFQATNPYLADEAVAALDALEAVARAARHVVDGTDPDGYLNLRAALERLDGKPPPPRPRLDMPPATERRGI